MVVAPTYVMLRDETERTTLRLARRIAAIDSWHASERRLVLIDGKEVLFRSGDEPDRLRGPNLAWAWVDEAALCERLVWDVLLGRLRLEPGRAWATSTPAGFNWLYDEFAHDRPGYELVISRTADNTYLPAWYLDQLRSAYTGAFASQELDAAFVDVGGAGLFLPDRCVIVDAASVPAGLPAVRRWDLAATTTTAGDWTVGALLAGPHDGRYYVTDIQRGRWEPAERNRIIRQTADMDGEGTRVVVPQDPGSGGLEAARTLVQLLAGHDVVAERETGDKVTRAQSFAAQLNAGNVSLVRAGWNRGLLDELRAFPRGDHDDQVDACAGAFNALTGRATKLVWVA